MSSQFFVFFTTLSLIYGSVLGQPVVHSPKIHGSVSRQPTVHSPMIHGSTTGQPTMHSSMIHGSTTGQPAMRSPMIQGSTTGQPTVRSPKISGSARTVYSRMISEPITGQPMISIGKLGTVSSAATLPECHSIVSELDPCVGYILKNEAKPSDTCCAGVKSLRQYNNNKAARQAICKCLESVATMFGNIDYSLLAGLPKMCRVSVKLPADISPSFDCSKA